MGFGLTDETWIEPDEGVGYCRDCDSWEECPSKCGWGWCPILGEFTEEGGSCDM